MRGAVVPYPFLATTSLLISVFDTGVRNGYSIVAVRCLLKLPYKSTNHEDSLVPFLVVLVSLLLVEHARGEGCECGSVH